MKEKIEFLMIIGNRAVMLAQYTVKALLKAIEPLKQNYEISVTLCLNGFNVQKNGKYVEKWRNLSDDQCVNVVYGGV